MIEPGDKALIDGPETKPTLVHRLFGVVVNVGAHHITVQTADGGLHVREHQSVARYVQPPGNWEHLYRGVERFSEVKESLVEHSKRPRRRSKTPRPAGEQ